MGGNQEGQFWDPCSSFSMSISGEVTGELEFVLFADDTNLFAEGHNSAGLFERVNVGLAELSRLTLNRKKDRVCLYHRNQTTRGPSGRPGDQWKVGKEG
jgi:hypothetical protein